MKTDQNITITNYSTDIFQINSEFKSEIFDQVDVFCQDKPKFVKELLTAQIQAGNFLKPQNLFLI